ncbi:MAG TPA: 23S rRNA (pseudouridine(1915)-N(3))-methyltransferase RlmH [Chitinophagaceae bacterium]|jgi:23S rRNA (pseudouridine1915-N3)-methyltransferase|nr:23S rRNA (pseudouridine(1915)-N(3))-methyltransferase RlmH [Chitinophagaceae bacterium]
MKVQLWAFGKEKETYIREGMQMFSQRLQHYCEFDLKILNAGKNTATLPPEELKKKEAKILLSILEPQHVLIALDERGREMTTLQFADLLEKHQMLASRTLVFLIGGAYGLDESVMLKARNILALSKLTFPHQLVRLIMAEQIYRGFTLLNHEKYHHQ